MEELNFLNVYDNNDELFSLTERWLVFEFDEQRTKSILFLAYGQKTVGKIGSITYRKDSENMGCFTAHIYFLVPPTIESDESLKVKSFILSRRPRESDVRTYLYGEIFEDRGQSIDFTIDCSGVFLLAN